MDKKPLERWMEVLSTVDESEAMVLKGFIESEGIPCRVESARVSQMPVAIGDLGEISVLVQSAQFEKVRRLMEETRREEGEP